MSTFLVAVLCLTVTLSVATDELVLPLGVTRDFVCTSPPESGYGIIWLVNDTSAASSQIPYIALGEEVQSDDGRVQRNITFTADLRANNTQLHCIVSSSRDRQIPVNVNLTLQGQLPAPAVTYEMSSDHHSVMFSWSAPFTLNISDMEPDILHYVVDIISDDGHNDTVITTDTHYELQADPCQSHQYHVEIAAVNVVGEGEKYMSPELTLEEYALAVVSDTAVSFRNRMAVIQMTVEVSPHCHETGVVNYEIELNATYSADRLLFKTSGDVSKHLVNISSPNITMNELYDYSVRIEGLLRSQSVRMNLSTFDIQYVNVIVNKLNSMHLDITCHFAEGSNAVRCTIILETLQEYNNTTLCKFVAFRDKDGKATVTVALPNGTYKLLAYDYESGARDNPAFTTTLSVQNSAHYSDCATVLSYENYSSSTNNITLVVIVILVSSSILVAVIITLITSIWFSKHKGKKFVPAGTEQNDYFDMKSVQIQPARSLSLESSSSTEMSSGSDPLDQSSHSTSPLVLVPQSMYYSGQPHGLHTTDDNN